MISLTSCFRDSWQPDSCLLFFVFDSRWTNPFFKFLIRHNAMGFQLFELSHSSDLRVHQIILIIVKGVQSLFSLISDSFGFSQWLITFIMRELLVWLSRDSHFSFFPAVEGPQQFSSASYSSGTLVSRRTGLLPARDAYNLGKADSIRSFHCIVKCAEAKEGYWPVSIGRLWESLGNFWKKQYLNLVEIAVFLVERNPHKGNIMCTDLEEWTHVLVIGEIKGSVTIVKGGGLMWRKKEGRNIKPFS